MNCPDCDTLCERDAVDVGIGVIYGPWCCYCCGWRQYDPYGQEKDVLSVPEFKPAENVGPEE